MEERLVTEENTKESSEFVFVTEEGSPDIKFQSKESFKVDEKEFTKMTAKFRMGQSYGNETFHATYWKLGKDISLKPSSINALVFISHGYAEYLGDDYNNIAWNLISQVGNGCLVFGHDHLGHGRTTAASSEGRAFVTDIEEYTDPIVAHVEAVQNLVKRRDEPLPIFLLGHSMGGLISIFTILNHPYMFKGFIGVGPLMKMHPDNSKPIMVFAVKAIQGCCPRFPFPRFIAGGGMNKITRRKMVVNKARTDRLRYQGGIKAGMAWFMFQNCEQAQNRFAELQIPMLILQGGSDRLVDPAASRMLVERSSTADKDKEFVTYADAYHQLLAELNEVKHDVGIRIINWINQQLNTS